MKHGQETTNNKWESDKKSPLEHIQDMIDLEYNFYHKPKKQRQIMERIIQEISK